MRKSNSTKCSFLFNDIQQNIFDGLMLGDGCINKQLLFALKQKTDKREYIEFICEQLNFSKERIVDIKCFDRRTDKIYFSSYYRSLTKRFLEVVESFARYK